MLEKEEYSYNVKLAVTFNQDKRLRELLLDKRFILEREGAELILIASKRGYSNILELLLKDERVNPAADNDAAFREACKNGQLKAVELLLQNSHVNPVADDVAALREACKNTHFETMELLLKDYRFNSVTVNKALLEEAYELRKRFSGKKLYMGHKYFNYVDGDCSRSVFYALYSKLFPHGFPKTLYDEAIINYSPEIKQLLLISNINLNSRIESAIEHMQRLVSPFRQSYERRKIIITITDFVMDLYKHIKKLPTIPQEEKDKIKIILGGSSLEIAARFISYEASEKYKSNLCFFHLKSDFGSPKNEMNADITKKILCDFAEVTLPENWFLKKD